MDFIPPFTIYKGYYKCSLNPGFPSGHTSLMLGFILGSIIPCIQILIWFIQSKKNNSIICDFRILFV